MKLLLFFLIISTLHTETSNAGNPNTFIDSDGDKITILDTEVRNKLNTANQIKASQIYDNQSDIEKFKNEYQKDILTNKNVTYGTYIVKSGDQLKKISQHLYGTTKKWKEIQVLNEDLLKNSTIKTGMKLKYIIYKKE